MSEAISVALMIVGAAFLLLAAVGITRMPDLFTRMQAATKATTLGVGCTMLAAAVYFREIGMTVRAALVIAFVFLTAPVAAHVIARAAYFVRVPLWEGTLRDELQGRYDLKTHDLAVPEDMLDPDAPRSPEKP